MKQTQTNHHIPVLLDEVLQYLSPAGGETYLDLTAGYGGHARHVLERTLNPSGLTLVDRDQNSIDFLRKQAELAGVEIIHDDFLDAAHTLQGRHSQYDMILADLGVSSPHLDNPDRGFSIRDDGPLDMRMDQTHGLSAADIVNTYDEAELVRVLRDYGEEPKARRIAQLIIEQRPFSRTGQLAEVVARAWPGHSKTHPATRTFQALRIAVNDELELLRAGLPVWVGLLKPGGRIVIISFHSLEDRIVKEFFREHAGDRYDAPLRPLTKRVVTASDQELVLNPRARSAKLRAAAK
ncbi:16S rRNA (cytosine(1402)-N(4))-methyltransferase RsmH [Candidatus Saccharibacteria bacterium]|nr:16S rRNA (cytosine(1402)-N(4))-methyltransferase RsmH [Candidatus Saccharibacteria bacterium]